MFYEKHLFFCDNQRANGKQCCGASGGSTFMEYAKERLKTLDLHGPGKIRVSKSGCLGRCASGPCLVIYPEGVWYRVTSFDDIDILIQEHLQQGQRVARFEMKADPE